jgi:predicted ribonuclease YlaK
MSKNTAPTLVMESQKSKIKIEDVKVQAKGIKENHQKAIDAFKNEKNLILIGCPGTGKTFIPLNLAIQEALTAPEIDQVLIVRSIVPLRDIGFLPGNKLEKCEDYEVTYRNICSETFNSNHLMYAKLKEQGVIDFQPTSFNQGITLHRTLIIVDESQNLNYTELYNIMTRLGDYSKIYFAGDYVKQDVVSNKKEKSGLEHFINVVKSNEVLSEKFEIIEMTPDDVLRNDIVKEFIIADFNYIDK